MAGRAGAHKLIAEDGQGDAVPRHRQFVTHADPPRIDMLVHRHPARRSAFKVFGPA